jgi:cell division septum initiation protein DivIVA
MSINEHTFGDQHSDTAPASGDGSQAAARLLEMTARETARWRADAKTEAAGVVAQARDEAARLVQTAHDEAERLMSSARDEAAQLLNDARVEAYQVRQQTTALREHHEADVAHLQQVATEHRERLRRHLTEVLAQVDSSERGGGQ